MFTERLTISEISMKVILQMDLFRRYMRIFNIRYLNSRKFGSHLRKYRKKISILYFSANGRSSRTTSSSPRRCARSACAPTRRTPMTWTCLRRRWRRLTPAAASAGCRLCQLLVRQISAIFFSRLEQHLARFRLYRYIFCKDTCILQLF